MTASYTSKHGMISKSPEELYMLFCDMRPLCNMVPESYRKNMEADYDSLKISYQGINISVRISERRPYELIRLISVDSPIEFVAAIHFDRAIIPGKTDFCIHLDANLNFMMKTMIGSKIQEALDKVVEGLEMASEGKMPEMPNEFKM